LLRSSRLTFWYCAKVISVLISVTSTPTGFDLLLLKVNSKDSHCSRDLKHYTFRIERLDEVSDCSLDQSAFFWFTVTHRDAFDLVL
jgi:hypothetical protein